MANEGHIKAFRKILEWDWYTDVNVAHLFIHCLLRANWKEGNFKGVVVPRGSFITSYDSLAHETGLSVHQIRVALKKLKMTNEVTTNVTSKYTMINVVNYRRYQDGTEKSGKQGGKQCDFEMAAKWQQYNNSNKERINNMYSNKKSFKNYSEEINPNQAEIDKLKNKAKKWGINNDRC